MNGKAKKALLLGLGAVCAILALGSMVAYSKMNQSKLGIFNEQLRAIDAEKIKNIVINEICSLNPGTVKDSLGAYSDYIELYNPNSTPVNLSEVCLSDDKTDLWRCMLSEISIPANGYAVIFADGSAYHKARPNLNFKISAGETIYLSYNGKVIDHVTVPELEHGQVWARSNDGTGTFQVRASSPGASNDNVYFVPAPKFSVDSGFYDRDFTLDITCEPGQTVYYTLDSSAPTLGSIKYAQPLRITDASSNENIYSEITNITTWEITYTPPKSLIDKATIVRAVAVDEHGNMSQVATASYFVGFQDKEGYGDMGVLSLVVEPDALFNEEYGLYMTGPVYNEAAAKVVEEYDAGKREYNSDGEEITLSGVLLKLRPLANFWQRGRENERIAHLEAFSLSGRSILSQALGFRIQGASTRVHPNKSFRLISRSVYSGSGMLESSLLDNDFDMKSLVLFRSDNVRKFMIQALVSNRSISVQAVKPYQVFLNGEYWGTYNVMEHYSSEYIAAHYGVAEDNVLLLEGYELQEGNDATSWRLLNTYASNFDLSKQEHYEAISGMMDTQSYIDWACSLIYTADMDTTHMKNVYAWRSANANYESEYADGRWRWMSYDTDLSAGAGENFSHNVDSFSTIGPYISVSIMEQPLFKALFKSNSFREQFVLSFMDMANYNFNAQRVSAMLDKIYDEYSEALTLDRERWGSTSNALDSQLSEIRIFFNNRFDYAVQHLADNFDLSGELVTLTISSSNPAGGDITLNTITPELANGRWSGKYYTDYPVTVTANPSPGYHFVKWETNGTLADGDATDKTVSVELSGDHTITAIYEAD